MKSIYKYNDNSATKFSKIWRLSLWVGDAPQIMKRSDSNLVDKMFRTYPNDMQGSYNSI